MSNECHRCGRCCREFSLMIPPKVMKKVAKRFRDSSYFPRIIKRMRGIEIEKPQLYRLTAFGDCKHFNKATTLCKIYNQERPELCRRFNCSTATSTGQKERKIDDPVYCMKCGEYAVEGIMLGEKDAEYWCFNCYESLLIET